MPMTRTSVLRDSLVSIVVTAFFNYLFVNRFLAAFL
ncbi:MAG: hypothetical protein HW414_84 [Dehalococcoidia bacterium]|nr:hypothetical protein [Dehalococcoidia bacterium]